MRWPIIVCLFWLESINPSEAKAQLIKSIKRDPRHAEALYELAKITMAEGEPTEALKYLQRLTQLAPSRADVYARLGELYLQGGQYTTAALNLWEARDLQPDSPEVERLLLRVYQQLVLQQQAVVGGLGKISEASR